jgi:hypothetical protein
VRPNEADHVSIDLAAVWRNDPQRAVSGGVMIASFAELVTAWASWVPQLRMNCWQIRKMFISKAARPARRLGLR